MIDIKQYTINLGMGKGMGKSNGGWEQIPNLTSKDIKNLDEIGYTGSLKKKKMSQGDYLRNKFNNDNTEIKAYMSKFDNGDFSEEYTVIISEYKKDKNHE